MTDGIFAVCLNPVWHVIWPIAFQQPLRKLQSLTKTQNIFKIPKATCCVMTLEADYILCILHICLYSDQRDLRLTSILCYVYVLRIYYAVLVL